MYTRVCVLVRPFTSPYVLTVQKICSSKNTSVWIPPQFLPKEIRTERVVETNTQILKSSDLIFNNDRP